MQVVRATGGASWSATLTSVLPVERPAGVLALMLASARPVNAQGSAYALGWSVVGETDTEAAILMLSNPIAPLARTGRQWFLGPTVGVGLVADRLRRQDVSFVDITLEGGRSLIERPVGSRTAGLAVAVALGTELLTPFDSTAAAPGQPVGRRTILAAVGRVEAILFGRHRPGGPPVALSFRLGRILRFGDTAAEYRLTDSWYWRLGFEIATR